MNEHVFHFLILMISASFDSLREFSSFAKNTSGVFIWTDFERINETHFWSATKQSFIKPDENPDLGNRLSFQYFAKLSRLRRIRLKAYMKDSMELCWLTVMDSF